MTLRLSGTTVTVLAYVMSNPSEQHYGLEIMKATGLASGSLYPILDRLVKEGWLTLHEKSNANASKKANTRKYYQLTPEGREAGQQYLAEHQAKVLNQEVEQIAELTQKPRTVVPQEERQMKIVVFFNHAGGSGKTSTARDLSVRLAELGFRCLLIDCDPQANLTKWMGVDPDTVTMDQTIQEVALGREQDLPKPRTVYGVDVIPSHLDLSGLEMAIHAVRMWHYKLKNAVRRLKGYDFVFLDAPASLAPIATMTAVAGELIFVPVPAQDKGLTGIKSVVQMINDFREANDELSLGGFVITNMDKRIRHQNLIAQALQEQLSEVPVLGPISYKPTVYGPATSDGIPVIKMPRIPKEYSGIIEAVEEIHLLADQFLQAVGLGAVEAAAQ